MAPEVSSDTPPHLPGCSHMLTQKLMFTAALAASLSLPSRGAAQEARLAPLRLGDRYLEANAGYSWYSPRGGGWGLITGRRVYLTALRAEWIINSNRHLAWGYVGEWTPLAVVQRVNRAETYSCYEGPGGRVCERDVSDQIALGTGISPVGLKMYLNPGGRTRPFAHAAGGGIAFTSEVPVRNSTHFNFTVEYGGGLEFARRDGRAVIVGFRFHHISNGSIGDLNPGLDANVVYLGFKKRRPGG